MKKTIRTILIIFLLFVIAIVAGFLSYLRWVINKPVSQDSSHKILEIKNGETTFQIAQRLKNKGLIRSDWVFVLNSKIKGKLLLSGYYNLSPNMSIEEIYNKISAGETNITKFTIPEGYRVEQIAQLLDEKDITEYQLFVTEAKKYEGKLFPDTYFIPDKMTAQDIIKLMNDNYVSKTKDLSLTSQDLIIASIVEREAVKDDERPVIAGIYMNRIKKHMKLEADPTVQYGKDEEEIKGLDNDEKKTFRFWKPITKKDYLTVKSSYNTYLIASLPPAPICNPGIKSIEATLNFAKHNYLYFLQNDGQIYTSENAAGHEENKKRAFGN